MIPGEIKAMNLRSWIAFEDCFSTWFGRVVVLADMTCVCIRYLVVMVGAGSLVLCVLWSSSFKIELLGALVINQNGKPQSEKKGNNGKKVVSEMIDLTKRIADHLINGF